MKIILKNKIRILDIKDFEKSYVLNFLSQDNIKINFN